VLNSSALDARYRRVLLVEEPRLRAIIARNLTGRGLEVRQAETASQAIQALCDETPDLLLLDINLPDRTGWDVLRDLRDRHADVPTCRPSLSQQYA
jgi:DNA-binding response OmpR family regulator